MNKDSIGEEKMLKALQDGVTDPEDIRKLSNLPTMAAVKRTADKLAMRQQYHDALDRNEMTMDWIVRGIKDIADFGKENQRLNAFKMLIGSMGLEKFEDMTVQGKQWEETMLRLAASQDPALAATGPSEDYAVKVPQQPDAMKKARAKDDALAKEMRKGNMAPSSNGE